MMWAATKGAYLLTVQLDDFFPNPRREDENFGSMICFHRRYQLGDEHDYSNSDDLIKDLYIKAAGGGDRGEQKYEDLTEKYDVWPLSSQRIQELNQALMSQIEKMYVVLPVYLLDHSGLAMSTTDFNDCWDSGQVGIIFVSNDKIKEEYEVGSIEPVLRLQVEERLKGEVAEYDAFLRGECYCYELYEDGELVHSCGGFIGAFDKAVKDMIEYLPDDCAGMVDDLVETNDSPSMVQTLLQHARIQVDQAAKDREHQSRQKSLDPVLS
ncbi:MAG: hypothetical protein IJV48_07870 [Ruminococcus sp.]|nr:hypothetical protein [Ruminococcus sp.]